MVIMDDNHKEKKRGYRNRKAYYEKNKDMFKRCSKAYYEKNKDVLKKNRKAYYEKNKDRDKEKRRLYYEKNKERFKEQVKEHYEKNKEAKNAKQMRKHRMRRIWLNELKGGLRCDICGMSFEGRPECCDFHHRDPSNKLKDISTIMGGLPAIKGLLDEISKCDALCANCHRTLHAIESNGGF